MFCIEEFAKGNEKFVVAHRGASGSAPENTLVSFQRAIESGVRMIEIDCHFTTDGRVAILHDLDLVQKSLGTDKTEFSFEELQQVDAGGWFSDEFRGEKIPALEDVLTLMKDRAFLNIEIKVNNFAEDIKNIDNLARLVISYGMEHQVILCSFQHELVKEIKLAYPNIHTGVIKIPGDFRMPSVIARETGCSAFICDIDEITPEISDDAEKHSIIVGVYSVDTIEQLDYILQFKVQALATNYPEPILRELRRRKIIA
jgi:glycerophosphoryl diester phosphodiesterase